MKLKIALVSNDRSETFGTADIEVDNLSLFLSGGSVLWDTRYFKAATISFGPLPDPFPMVEELPTPILLTGITPTVSSE